MIADKNRIYDGWLSLEGGVDGGRAANQIDINQVASADNITFRGGEPSVRPGFRRITEQHPTDIFAQRFCYGERHDDGGHSHAIGEYLPINAVPSPIPSYLTNQNSQYIYENGVFQGALAYSPHHGEDCIMAMIGGRLFRIVPGVSTATVREVVPDDPPYGDFSEDKKSYRNRQDLPVAYFCQGDKYLFVQDGNSRCIIYDSVRARRSLINADRDHTEVPTGTIMTYGMGRLCVCINSRDIAFGDLFGSHDLPDAADSIVLFTERNFLTEGFDAAIPFEQGLVTGMQFFPQLDTSTGNGQLLVFAERGAASFFLSLPRDQWKTSQFQILALLTTGLRGHRSISVVNEDLWFRADDGVRSYRQARSEPSGWAHIPLSTNVKEFITADTDWLLKYASSIYFDNRVILTTSPVWFQGKPCHQGFVVVDFDILSSFGTQFKPAWEGHWTFTDGRYTCQILTGSFNGQTRAFAFTIDPVSGTNQLMELSLTDWDDWNGQEIPWEVVMRKFDFQKLSQQSTPFNEVELYDADLWVKEVVL